MTKTVKRILSKDDEFEVFLHHSVNDFDDINAIGGLLQRDVNARSHYLKLKRNRLTLCIHDGNLYVFGNVRSKR